MSEATQQPVNALVKAAVPVTDRGVVLRDIESLYRFSTAVANSELAPKDFRGKPDSVMVAIQMGMEVGLTPMSALQNIAVINGRPSIWGDAQLAIVRSSGALEAFEETECDDKIDPLFRELCFESDADKRKALKIKIAQMQSSLNKTADDYGVTCFVKRAGFNESFGRFTVADAKKAQLWGKQGPWSQYPARMLKFRARSFLLRDQFGDALKGMLTREEAADFIDIEASVASAPIPKAEATTAPLPQLKNSKPRIDGQTGKPKPEPDPIPVKDEKIVELKQPEPVKETAPVDPPKPAEQQPAAPAESTASTTPTPSSNSTENSGASPAPKESKATAEPKTAKGWLPYIDESKPEEVLSSLREWLKTEEITDDEFITWGKTKLGMKDGDKIESVTAKKMISVLKQKDVVWKMIMKSRG